MKLRAPAVPLITVDPYFSVWSFTDKLNGGITRHWTGKPNPITGIVEIDGTNYTFMGTSGGTDALPQQSCEITALSTSYRFTGGGISLETAFLTPLLPDDLPLLSRPVTYLSVKVRSLDSAVHKVRLKLIVSEDICLDQRGQKPVSTEEIKLPDGTACARMGAVNQDILSRSGDDLRIDWGYFYLAARGESRVNGCKQETESGTLTGLTAETRLEAGPEESEALFAFAYDDLYCLEYFGERLKAYWKKDGQTIEEILALAFREYDGILRRCADFSGRLYRDAAACGGEKYAEILCLSYRQVIAAHKLALNKNGDVLFVSKECFSNGCAATVDVSYPSVPLFLLYNPELIYGMLRPIFDFIAIKKWPYDFAPHDAGCYPLLNGQVYGESDVNNQMPVEECGNMILMIASAAVATKDAGFAGSHWALLTQWADYLVRKGLDPENQLCTDDFAGHLSHNCNLSVKAIMAIEGYAILCAMRGENGAARKYRDTAQEMATEWLKMADNKDGSTMLAFDKPGTFSLKYNLIWDVLFGTGLFDRKAIDSEVRSYVERHMNRYGIPLDSRAAYTKSDWLLYCAALSDDGAVSARIIESLWNCYNESPSRVPLTDWYDTESGKQIGFQNRTVQGGLYMPMLKKSGICRYGVPGRPAAEG